MCALKQLISPVIMFFYSDVRIWLEGAAVATASFILHILIICIQTRYAVVTAPFICHPEVNVSCHAGNRSVEVQTLYFVKMTTLFVTAECS